MAVITSYSIHYTKLYEGSCDSKNNIRYNWRIVMANNNVIDYLIAHELSHIIEKNHSKNFWNEVETILPNYKKWP